MKLLQTTHYYINHAKYTIDLRPTPSPDDDLKDYLDDLLKKVAKGEVKREFKFSPHNTTVQTEIMGMMNGKPFADMSLTIAQRFLRIESKTITETANLKGEIPEGLLIQVLFEDDDGITKIVISKSDNADYLGKDDLLKHQGFPIKKKMYKAFLVDFDQAKIPGKVYVLDTTSTLSKYWWSDFLELDEVNTDTYNTNKAFDSIDQKVLQGIKKAFPADHNILKNRVIGYFKSTDKFALDDFIDKAIGAYNPDDPAFDVEGFKNKIRGLPAKENFDSQFNLVPEEIKARRLKNVVHLSDEIDLVIKDNVKDYENVIKAVEEKGVKYIKIRTDSGYKAFKN